MREDAVDIYKRRALPKKTKETPFLTEFSRNLSEMAERRVFDPLIGREQEVERMVQILSRRTKNNPLYVGDPGVGKTRVLAEVAKRRGSPFTRRRTRDRTSRRTGRRSRLRTATVSWSFRRREGQ